jgi:hypothetical protein
MKFDTYKLFKALRTHSRVTLCDANRLYMQLKASNGVTWSPSSTKTSWSGSEVDDIVTKSGYLWCFQNSFQLFFFHFISPLQGLLIVGSPFE